MGPSREGKTKAFVCPASEEGGKQRLILWKPPEPPAEAQGQRGQVGTPTWETQSPGVGSDAGEVLTHPPTRSSIRPLPTHPSAHPSVTHPAIPHKHTLSSIKGQAQGWTWKTAVNEVPALRELML